MLFLYTESKQQKSSGWFGGDAEALLADRLKSTLILCYGYVTAYADSEYVAPAARLMTGGLAAGSGQWDSTEEWGLTY